MGRAEGEGGEEGEQGEEAEEVIMGSDVVVVGLMFEVR